MTTRDYLSARQIARKAIPLLKAHIHDEAYTANADMLGADITPSSLITRGATVTPPCMFRIMVCLDTAAVFKVIVDDGTSEVDMEMNSGAQLDAQSTYIFDVLVHEDDEVNFEADQNVQIEKLIVHEVALATQ